VIAKTVGKDQTQQGNRGNRGNRSTALYHASLPKSARLPGTLLKSCHAPKPLYDMFPVAIHERFVTHPTLNHKSIPASKSILTPMRARGGHISPTTSSSLTGETGFSLRLVLSP
jgi:hypothetical protein